MESIYSHFYGWKTSGGTVAVAVAVAAAAEATDKHFFSNQIKIFNSTQSKNTNMKHIHT